MTFLEEKIIAVLLVLLFTAGLFFAIGSKHEKTVLTAQYETKIAQMTAQENQALAAAAVQEHVAMQKQVANVRAAAAADQQHQLVQVKTRTVYKTIHDKVIEYVKTHPAPVDCSVNADFMRIWNQANQPAASDATGTAASGDSADHAGQVPTAAAGQ
jgi:hypothetical protein